MNILPSTCQVSCDSGWLNVEVCERKCPLRLPYQLTCSPNFSMKRIDDCNFLKPPKNRTSAPRSNVTWVLATSSLRSRLLPLIIQSWIHGLAVFRLCALFLAFERGQLVAWGREPKRIQRTQFPEHNPASVVVQPSFASPLHHTFGAYVPIFPASSNLRLQARDFRT